MNEEEFSESVLKHAREALVELSETQARLLGLHVRIMLEWNERINLTRITAPKEVIIKHILDSIAPAKHLPESGRALDVGAGAGFPGIPLKIVHPDLQMVLLESSRKKAGFLAEAAQSLALPGLTVLHSSWQDFRQDKENHGKFALIVMRALKPEPEHLRRLAPSLLSPGGFFARWEVLGDKKDSEETKGKIPESIGFHGDFEYRLPGVERRRAVRFWRKN